MVSKSKLRGLENGSGRNIQNPQDATIPEEDEDEGINEEGSSAEAAESPEKLLDKEKSIRSKQKKGSLSKKSQQKKPRRTIKRKKRDRIVHLVDVEDESTNDTLARGPAIPLPLNQYTTTLCRRAIRNRTKEGESPPQKPTAASSTQPTADNTNAEQQQEQPPLEEYGDTSLGMVLTNVGGRFIVKKLVPLHDGRASPAQMVGVIRRGDVLLSVNRSSVVNLPVDQWSQPLKPWTTPDESGAYQRYLHLRFAAGEGLEALKKKDAAEARQAHVSEVRAANEIFSLFPMVDHLGGVSSYQMDTYIEHAVTPQQKATAPNTEADIVEEEKKDVEKEITAAASSSIPQNNKQYPLNPLLVDQHSLNMAISQDLEYWRTLERDRFMSEFFAWNEHCSDLLRPSKLSKMGTDTRQQVVRTRKEMTELGRRALLGADALSRIMESMDRGKDMRSFRSWNSSVSLRSRASTRRRYILDAASLPVRFNDNQSLPVTAKSGGGCSGLDDGSFGESGDSDDEDMEDMDGDELLLRLAAHDEIWRKQVIEALEETRDNLGKEGDTVEAEEKSQEDEPDNSEGNMDSAMHQQLGAFLFGETMAKIVTEKKKSKALPPDEITAVLFDLSTNLASSMPDEFTMSASGGGTALMPFGGSRRTPEAGSSVILATRFVLDEALPVWLETFCPLLWKSRRVLWKPTNQQQGFQHGSVSASRNHTSDVDSLTVDSDNASPTAAGKGLVQTIEDQELDVETRAETCFLVTYYFTQRLLPKVAVSRNRHDNKEAAVSGCTEELVEFVRKYGAYMRLHTSLAYSAASEFPDVIQELLKLAEHDPRHRENMKLLLRRNSLVLYEPTMLSAVVSYLPQIRDEPNPDRRQALIDVCVTAYPDLCPWQVKRELLTPGGESPGSSGMVKCSPSDLRDLYYAYLSSLLHPQEGHEGARKEKRLVEEWCLLSLEVVGNKKEGALRRRNFFRVASRNSSDHLAYRRDLVMLLRLSMMSCEYDLALDLAGEILDHPMLAKDKSVISQSLDDLRNISRHALSECSPDRQTFVLRTLKRVLRLLHEMASNPSSVSRNTICLADELQTMLEHKESCQTGSDTEDSITLLVDFLAKEAPVSDFLKALAKWTASHERRSHTVHVLQNVLRKGAHVALNTELSGSLLRLRRARLRNHSIDEMPQDNREDPEVKHEYDLWNSMSEGVVTIEK